MDYDKSKMNGSDREKPYIMKTGTTKEYIGNLITGWQPKSINLAPLIDAAPFKIQIKNRH